MPPILPGQGAAFAVALACFRGSLGASRFPSVNTPPDRFKVPNTFWTSLRKIGLTPAAVLQQSQLPATVYDGEKNIVTTAQFFALWEAIGELSSDPAAGLNFGRQFDIESYHPLAIAALHARDFRDALTRVARYKELCCPEEMLLTESKDEYVVESSWFYATGDYPPALTDAIFASLLELGRRGTDTIIRPKRVELKRPEKSSTAHEAYFRCPVKFRARRNALVLQVADLGRPFVTHSSELLEMLGPQLERELDGRKARARIGDRVKWILKRLLAGNRPDILAVARQLGLSARTLQRQITAEGASFRQLLLEARQELVRQYLRQPSIEITEAAYLLGYEDPNSFYRAFRTWEGTTPAHWRSMHRTPAANRNCSPWVAETVTTRARSCDSSNRRHRAAIDDVFTSRDRRRAIRSEEHHQFGDFSRPIGSAKRDAAE